MEISRDATSAMDDHQQSSDTNGSSLSRCLQKRRDRMRILDEFRVTSKPILPSERLPFLSGNLTKINDGSSRKLVLRGVWGYQKSPDHSPQRFELISDLAFEEKGCLMLPSSCTFNGSFVDHHTVVGEKDVKLTFQAFGAQPLAFIVKGCGINTYGKFELKGDAKHLNRSGEVSFSLMLTKTYIQSYQLHRLPSNTSRSTANLPKTKKRKSSATNSTMSDFNDTTIRQLKVSNEIDSTDPSRTNKYNSDSNHKIMEPLSVPTKVHFTTDSMGYTAEDDAFTLKKSSAPSGHTSHRQRITVFDQVHYAKKDSTRPTSSLLSDTVLDYLITAKVTKDSCDAKCLREINGSWKEFGALSNAPPLNTGSPQLEAKPCLRWTIRDVKPSFSKITIDFCESVGIYFANDLLKADTSDLRRKLIAFPGFRLACAMAAWKTRQNFHDVYKMSLAKHSIKKWKLIAETWWQKTALSSWINIEVRLSNFLSTWEASFLEKNCGIIAVDQLLISNKNDILSKLHSVNNFGTNSLFLEGMFHSWIMRAREKSVNKQNLLFDSIKTGLSNCPEVNKNITTSQYASTHANMLVTQDQSFPKYIISNSFCIKIPISCIEFLFMRSENITTDKQLSRLDVYNVASRYKRFLEVNNRKVSFLEANQIVSKWKDHALNCLGKKSKMKIDAAQFSTRIDKSPQNLSVMYTVNHLSSITINDGMPTKTIYTFDDANDSLYKFRVNIDKSRVSENGGNGAFLTFEGCKVLKISSLWKKKNLSDIPYVPQTRRALTAAFTGGFGATVTVKGKNIHGDEYFYGPENGIGIFKEYTLDDFIDVDNITFSSKHVGCAMIELDRYAPLLPRDRKTDHIFWMKDFVYSHEPSSWRFDVSEELNGHKQVVDFTDDTSGEPHSIAKSHVAMYVNEVGHDESLVENVCPLETPRSVSYYIFIDRPMTKGEEVELLVNYGERYEEIRIRRGYGKLNIASDTDDYSRIVRNVNDRLSVEESILTCTEEDIKSAIDFFERRVWDGLMASKHQGEKLSTFRRRYVARRRLQWMCNKFRVRLMQLCSECTNVVDKQHVSHNSSTFFHVGMFVYVNGWAPIDDPRPPYTGIATIDSIARDSSNKHIFNVSISGSSKLIYAVPEETVTLPTEKDFVGLSNTVLRTWKKQRKEKIRTQLRAQILLKLDTLFQWDITEIHQEPYPELLLDYRWEISEEILIVLKKHDRLPSPFDKTKWCPLSQFLLQEVLHAIADHIISSTHENTKLLCSKILSLASETVESLRAITNERPKKSSLNQVSHIRDLSLLDITSDNPSSILIVQSIKTHKVSVDDFQLKPQPLDFEWYLCHQIVMALHPILSSIDWPDDSFTSSYSLRFLCEQVGLDFNSQYLTLAHFNETLKPLLSLF